MPRIKIYLLFLSLVACTPAFSQMARESAPAPVDSLYREDQFYLGLTYNFLVDKPSNITNSGFSGGIHGGFLRDFPINKRRNIAIAIGVGLAYDQFGHNFFVGAQENNESIFRILDEYVHYDSNRFNMATVQLPIEFRWRSSTPTDYQFWRIYAGLRLGYVYWFQSYFKQANNKVVKTKIDEFNPFRLSASLAFGYSTFNFYIAYDFIPWFDKGETMNGEPIDFQSMKVGLIFYIL
ncbi:MAG TPA: porin family protein [Flavobacteriaceae bacterium]|nr:porin family protein [Flavobacteriaceae bacterium]